MYVTKIEGFYSNEGHLLTRIAYTENNGFHLKEEQLLERKLSTKFVGFHSTVRLGVACSKMNGVEL